MKGIGTRSKEGAAALTPFVRRILRLYRMSHPLSHPSADLPSERIERHDLGYWPPRRKRVDTPTFFTRLHTNGARGGSRTD